MLICLNSVADFHSDSPGSELSTPCLFLSLCEHRYNNENKKQKIRNFSLSPLSLSTSEESDRRKKTESEKEIQLILQNLRKGKVKGVKVCNTQDERAFVEAWIVHCTYKLLFTQEQVIKATDSQILEVMRRRSGTEMDRRKYYRLKDKFLSREKKPATKLDLLRVTMTGRREKKQRVGIPSEHVLTGLGSLFEQDRDVAKDDDLPILAEDRRIAGE